jgi:hypothetical protein
MAMRVDDGCTCRQMQACNIADKLQTNAEWLLVQIDMPYGGIPVKDTGCANVLVTGGLAAV